MRILLATAVVLATSIFGTNSSVASEISQKSCESYSRNASFSNALDVISTAFRKASRDELCSMPHLFDVHITNRTFFNMERRKEEPHVWVTLHYAEHSCQYFVRIEDWEITRKNCYNTI